MQHSLKRNSVLFPPEGATYKPKQKTTYKHLTLNDWSRGKQLILFPKAEPRETLRFEGNKINWFPERPVIK